MIAVPSTEPTTTRAASPRRRAIWRRASRRRNGRRTAMNAATAKAIPSRATRVGVRLGYTGLVLHPDRAARLAGRRLPVCLGALLVGDPAAVAPADRPPGRAPGGRVGGDQHDGLAVLVQLVQQVDDLGGHLGVEVAGRLIGPHDRRPRRQRPGHRDPLLLPPGPLVWPVRG